MYTRILIHSVGARNETQQAEFDALGQQPELTYTGVGIGNNINNYSNTNGGLKLLNTAQGGPYIRLLNCAMQFVVNSGGDDKSVIYINVLVNVGIGPQSPDAKLAVNGSIHSKEVKVDLNVPTPDYFLPMSIN